MRKLIPPFLVFGCIALMWLVDRWLPIVPLFGVWRKWAGILLLLTGFLSIVAVGLSLLRHRTEVHTFKRPVKLITDGLFRYSRNPIYLGFLTSLVGVWIYLGSLSPVIGCIVFFLAAQFGYIPFEEAMLRREFGEVYEAYRQVVRRWVGRF